MHIHPPKRVVLAARAFRLAVVAACVLFVPAPSAAEAASVPAELRVEGSGGADLTHGWTYFSDTATIATETAEPCNGTGRSHTARGATALGILEHARRPNRRLDPVLVSDRFDFGLFVCGIGRFRSSSERFWTVKVNHVALEIAAEQYTLRPGDDVLWTFQDLATGSNTGNELELVAPGTVDPGEEFEVSVFEYDFSGAKSPAGGVEISGRDGPVAVTDARGTARLAFDGESPSEVLRAYRGIDVPSAPTRVCVGTCKRIAKKRIFGTTGRDVIGAGGEFAEYVYAAGGHDRIDVRGDSFSDKVRCGRGRDRVLADGRDRVGRDCERVVRS